MNLENLMSEVVEVALACNNQNCPSFVRDETDSVCRYFDLRCGDCNSLIRLGDAIPEPPVSATDEVV